MSMPRVTTLLVLLAALGGCGLVDSGASAAAAGESAAQQAAQARRDAQQVPQQVPQQIDAANRVAAEQRSAAEAQAQ
jgi:hypothetical protein